MRIYVLTAALLALAGPPALAQSNVPEMEISSYWREDIALERILSPPETIYVGDSIRPAVMGRNHSLGSRHLYLACIIDDDRDGYVYSAVQGVSAPARGSFTVNFALSWAPEEPGEYHVRFFLMQRDRWPKNDTIRKTFVVLPREGGFDGSGREPELSSARDNDVGLVRILSPPDTVHVGDTIRPAVMGMNYGRWGERPVFVACIIDDGTDAYVYSSIQGITVHPQDSFVVTFAVPWLVAGEPGEFLVRFWCWAHGDRWPENDTIVKTFAVLPREGGLDGSGPERGPELRSARDEDIGLLRIPLPPDTIHVGDSVYVSLEGMNHGYPRNVYMGVAIDDGLDRVVYATIFGIMVPHGSFDLGFAVPWGAQRPGEFSVHFWLARHDHWPENDSISKTVVVLPRGGGIQAFRSREPASREFRVRPSIVRVGGMISVNGLGPGSRAKLIDAAGRVKGHLAPGLTAIAAPCLPGVYFIKREEDDRTVRVLVQP